MVQRRRTPVGAILVVGICALGGGCETPAVRDQGIIAYNRGDHALAENRLTRALEQNPGDWESQYYLGMLRLQQGRPLDAQVALEKALALHPHQPDTRMILDGLAEAVYRQDQPERLSTMLQRSIEEYGTSGDYLRQARYLAKIGDVDGARLAYRKAAHFATPGDPKPYIALSEYLESVGDHEGALLNLQHAYFFTPTPELAERFRRYGIVPGPTQAVPPPRD